MANSILKELQRRNVFKVTVAYAIVSWLILQIVSSISPMLNLPDVFGKMVLVLLIIGFPIALIFAWAFELTPEGVKPTKDVDLDTSITPQTSRKIDFVIITALVLIIGGFLGERFIFDEPPAVQSLSQQASKQLADTVAKGNAKAKNTEFPSGQHKLTLGVAVLPFKNMSKDPNNAFFTGGVYEDVLTYLSRITQLRIISRTSMEKIALKGMEIPAIGKYLDVSHVLEGSVRRAGNQVRVTVQLIDASDDKHIWAQNYDRSLKDIFAIQTEIAKKIAQKLETKLTIRQQQLLENQPTTNIKAYDLFLKAREFTRVWRGSKNFKKQIPLLEQALQLDPDFVEVQVKLVETYGRMAWTGADPNDIYRPQAEALKNQIVAKHPDTAAAFAAQAYLEYTIKRDYQAAINSFKKALSKRHNDPDYLRTLASSYKRSGQFKQGIKILRQLLSSDPEHPSNANELVTQLIFANKNDIAFAQAKINIRKFPDNPIAQVSLAILYFSDQGDIKNYLKIIKQMPPDFVTENVDLYLQLIVNKDNIQALATRLQAIKKTGEIIRNALIDSRIAALFNLLGLEQPSQLLAQKSLLVFQQHPNKLRVFFANQLKTMNGIASYTACLAKDKAAFKTYDIAYQSAHTLDVLEEAGSNVVHALAVAECGQIVQAWKILNNQVNLGFAILTPWDIVLKPIFRHYFAELPEFKALEVKMQQQKQAQDNQGKVTL